MMMIMNALIRRVNFDGIEMVTFKFKDHREI